MADQVDTSYARPDGREPDQLREITFQNGIAPHATGSTLINWGDTRVICGVTVEESVPRWMKEQGVKGGWITAEYSMLPYSTHTRKSRDSSKGKIDGRSMEIQRLIGRSLRSAIDLEKLGARTLWIDCDVLQADGGTRCASITGAYIALCDAVAKARKGGKLKRNPILGHVAAVSVGVYQGQPVLDLDYLEDSACECDMNVVMNDAGHFIEVQGTAEGHAFRREELDQLLDLASGGISQLIALQRQALEQVA